MAVLYVTTPGSTVRISGDTVRVTRGSKTLTELPTLRVDCILIFGNSQVTTQLLHYAAREGLRIFFLTGRGKFIASLSSGTAANLPVRRAQFRLAEDADFTRELARGIVAAKLRNCRSFVRRMRRDGVISSELGEVADDLTRMVGRTDRARELDSLRGIEGTGARCYFRALRGALDPHLEMAERSRRPPKDPGNALLSLAYSLLFTQVYAAVECAGLDPYQGFYHGDRYGRPALALDLMEEFRPVIADRFVVASVRHRVVTAADFMTDEEIGIALQHEAFGRFCSSFAKAMERTAKHPLTGQTISFRRTLDVQARLLAKVLRGEDDEYRPYLLEG